MSYTRIPYIKNVWKNRELQDDNFLLKAIESLREDILTELKDRSINKDDHTFGMFMDLSKAFYSVNHNFLLNKLEDYGIHGVPMLIESYLKYRRQRFAQRDMTTRQKVSLNGTL